MKTGIPDQREHNIVRITCPICERAGIAMSTIKTETIGRHSPKHEDWLWTPWCGGGGETVEGADAIRSKIDLLVREGYMLRQVEQGYEIAKPYPPGSAVGMTQERIDEEQERFKNMASGVEHSVNILRGEPLFGEDEPENVDEKVKSL